MRKYLRFFVGLVLIAALLNPSSNPFKKYILGPTGTHKTIYVSDTFDDDEYQLVKEAAAEWVRETHGLVQIDIKFGFDADLYNKISVDPDSMVMVRAVPDDPLVEKLDELVTRPILGYFLTQFKTKTILVVPGRMLSDDYYRAVMIHEMGHAIGLNHISKNEDTIMYDSMNTTYHLTKTDIEWFCRAYYCKASRLGGI